MQLSDDRQTFFRLAPTLARGSISQPQAVNERRMAVARATAIGRNADPGSGISADFGRRASATGRRLRVMDRTIVLRPAQILQAFTNARPGIETQTLAPGKHERYRDRKQAQRWTHGRCHQAVNLARSQSIIIGARAAASIVLEARIGPVSLMKLVPVAQPTVAFTAWLRCVARWRWSIR